MTENNFFTKLPYLIFISILTFFFWGIKPQGMNLVIIGVPLFLGIIFILLVFMKNTIYILPFLLNLLFMINQTEWDLTTIPLYLYVTPPLLIFGFIIHIIKYKTNIFRGKFLFAIIFYASAIIISAILNGEYTNISHIYIYIYAILLVFMYGFFTNTMPGDNLDYLIRILVILGVLISFEVLYYYLTIGDIRLAIDTKSIDLGWGISNFIATYLIMFISVMTYFVKKYKLHIFWIILLLFETMMLLFTLSRAGIIAFLVTLIFLIIFMFTKYEHKFNLLMNLVFGTVIMAFIGYLFKDYFLLIYHHLAVRGLDDSGRIQLWYEAIAKFKASPIFGTGFFSRNTLPNELRMFHNTILHTLACFGIIGGLGLLLQFISILKIFFAHLNQKKAILLIALVGANIHGMVDNIYLMPQYMVIMFVIIAVVENANKIDNLRLELQIK